MANNFIKDNYLGGLVLKRKVLLIVVVLMFLLSISVPAWSVSAPVGEDDPKIDSDHLPIANQKGVDVWGIPWWVDSERVIHFDYSNLDKNKPGDSSGAHTVVGRHLTSLYQPEGSPPDWIEIRHNVCTVRTHGNTIKVNSIATVGSYEVFSVDGIPFWRWIEEDPDAKATYDFDVKPTGNDRFYQAVKCAPGQKKLEIWITPTVGGFYTAALHTWETVTPYYLPVRPFEEFGRVYVPIRGVLDKLGAEVEWNAQEKAAVVSTEGKTIVLKPGSTTALVNGEPVTMDVPPKIKENRMMLPLRFVSETLGYSVSWQPDGPVKQVVVSTK